jgi:predicted esterase
MAFLRFEQTLRAHPAEGAEAAKASDAFDQATMGFFLGRIAGVAEGLDRLTLSLLPEAERPAGLARAFALRVRIDPPVLVPGSGAVPTVGTGLLYELPSTDGGEVPLRLRLVGPDGKIVLERDLPTSGEVPLAVGGATLPAVGDHVVQVVLPGGTPVAKGRWSVVAKSLDAVRAANEARLLAAAATHPDLQDAIAAARGRTRLLADRPPTTESASILLAGAGLAAAVETEIATIEAGKDPYAGREGDLWRVVPFGDREIRVRQFVPPPDPEGKPLPVVVALHGMGGDENLFFEGYGAGLLRDLAKERRFLLVAPRTPDLVFDPAALERVLEAVLAGQGADRKRVLLLGHSLGAGVTTLFVNRRPDLLRAACAIAGAGAPKDPKLPFLRVVGARDGIVRSGRVPAPGETSGGVEVRVYPDHGHTLVVPAALPEIVDWLLSR